MRSTDERAIDKNKLLFLVTEDWYFRSHRLGLARRARDAGYDVCIGTRLNTMRRELEQEGFSVCDIPFERSLRLPHRDLAAYGAIRALIRDYRPDVVHLVSLKPILLGGAALLGWPRVSVVAAFTGLGYIFSSRDRMARVLRPVVVAALRRIARGARRWVLAQNADDLSVLAHYGIGRAEQRRIIRGAGVDLDEFKITVAPTVEVPLIVLPGRVLVDKGVFEFVEAARLVHRQGVTARFALVGGYDPDNPGAVAAKVVETWVSEGLVEWWGHCECMPEIYAQASIVVLPSFREGLPKALLEAAACGRPLVATAVPGCREICINEETGLSVQPQDAAALAGAIVRLLSDVGLRARLVRGARELVEREFSLDRIAQQTLQLYAETLSVGEQGP